MHTSLSAERGFSLLETMIAIGVLSVGLMGAAAVIAQGMTRVASSPYDVITTQKAVEAIESVFSARDSHKLTWSQIQNVNGATGSDGGVFIDAPTNLLVAGQDGLVGTADDGGVAPSWTSRTTLESMVWPGKDQLIGTADDVTVTLSQYKRQITIRDIPNEPLNCGLPGPDPCTLRSVTVTVVYYAGGNKRTYTLATYISNYS
jgi:prepilin-type N-terminal cleavage/methylation domain-containing protein